MANREKLQALIDNIEKVVIGKRDVAELLTCALLCRGHVLVEDVPGVGKTSLALALARSLGLTFRRIQFTPDVMPSDITGYTMFDPKKGDFSYHMGLVMSQVVLADEINRASPKTQSSLLEAMEERSVTVDGKTYKIPEPFLLLATQNPIDLQGTYPLPEAQLDRFMMKVRVGYPQKEEEEQILEMHMQNKRALDQLTPVLSSDELADLQDEVGKVSIKP
ncbi:MAG: AAA family ATPase, partial [Clostridia bacterium]|nr:AAA family ATPase [Clostridia bacterium]